MFIQKKFFYSTFLVNFLSCFLVFVVESSVKKKLIVMKLQFFYLTFFLYHLIKFFFEFFYSSTPRLNDTVRIRTVLPL